MSKNNSYKVCVVGLGNWGVNHAKTLFKLGHLGGIVDSDTSRIDSYPILKDIPFFSSIDKAFIFGFDGYIVATPPASHFSIAQRIIKNGNHLLVEKPLTLNSKDAIELNELAKSHNVNLMVGHVLLFHPAFQKISEIISSGKLGDIQYIYSNRTNLGVVRTHENVFWSLAPHDIALFQYLVKDEPIKITSNGKDVFNNSIHDTTITNIEYKNGVMGHIFVSWLHPFKEHRFVIIGSKGMIRFEDSIEGKPLIFYDKSIQWLDNHPKPRSGSSQYVDYEKTLPLDNELKYFIDHLDGTSIKIANSESGIAVIKILEKATLSLLS
jgi:predicted dehydrogenase